MNLLSKVWPAALNPKTHPYHAAKAKPVGKGDEPASRVGAVVGVVLMKRPEITHGALDPCVTAHSKPTLNFRLVVLIGAVLSG